ncbi:MULTISPECIES: hypothetical protein [Vibrio]|mgnify:CR=1 FL=1|jgi:hypothetical protein|uniref:Uncharacterized protein n=2 Tax=Vibrio TaxID=662 RepID=A0A2N7JPR6_VIBSP|nr:MULTISPECIES: hypothetical protein [Vibrio]MCK8071261.1 hypothetical protein [Vibrio sp. 1CM23M]MCK8077204.1 hypothetical protein [Vibrio sp. 1CM2L]PMI54202.1 hypothetical protein BCU42_18820 [Vibrio splendidus]PMI72547.1 hypothetical protein BCU38_21515 [Vibrio splendidus]PMM49349.1 hypothetical protein BCT54_24790 [Vibrio splendidus]
MNLLGQIFGSQSMLERGLKTITQTGDAMFFTDEEKAKHKLALLRAYEPFKLVQRYIVLLFTVPYVLLHSFVVIGCMHGYEWQPIGVMINEAFGYPVLAIIGLYLTGGVLPKKK